MSEHDNSYPGDPFSTAVHSLEKRIAELETKYGELVYAVCKKYPGESRHETALRYITEAERYSSDTESTCKALEVSDEDT